MLFPLSYEGWKKATDSNPHTSFLHWPTVFKTVAATQSLSAKPSWYTVRESNPYYHLERVAS